MNLVEPDQVTRMKFHVLLPTNETVQVKLSFKLLTPSKMLPVYTAENFINTSVENLLSTSAPETILSTNIPDSSSTTAIPSVDTYLTVEEVIEAFRQDLIKKEIEIAGIIESDHPFYRHFKLKFDNNVEIPIRCTYEADYANQSLKISCYEYMEFENQRILSNGEIEQSAPLKGLPEYINIKDMKQTYNMTIS